MTDPSRFQKGLSASTVREDLRIRFTSELMGLREGSVQEVQFPSHLSNTERKFLHQVAQELGLKSKSRGKGESRFITVTKPVGSSACISAQGYEITYETRGILRPLVEACDRQPVHIQSSHVRRSSRGRKDGRGRRDEQQHPSAVSVQHVEHFISRQTVRRNSPEYASLQSSRAALPAHEHRDSIVEMVDKNSVSLISGDTGCGKTTQVPQFLLDDERTGATCRIAVTQPRRISAMTVSERIAYERGEQLGDIVGYNIRLESECGPNTKIHFMTPGILLRLLQDDPTLSAWTHIIIDEAHERDRYTEFLFIVLRDLLQATPKRASVKLILMSATMHTARLSEYFGGVPHLRIGSSMYPVEEFYLEHVLRITGVVDTLSSSSRPAPMKKFRCPICNNPDKEFLSAVELGTHVALCTGSSTISSSSQQNEEQQHHYGNQQHDDDGDDYGTEYLEDVSSADGGDSDRDGDDEEGLVPRDVIIPSDVVGVSAAVPQSVSVEDEELLRRYQLTWDDSMVDLNLICSLMQYVFRSEFCRNGGVVLVFLPGWDDISKLKRMLVDTGGFGDTRRFKVLQLHSGIPKSSQREVFRPVPPGMHKIVLSTNIAETSVTIDNVTVVIDSGRVKEKVYDPHIKLSSLKENWISQSSARQRKGRAGRTRAGVVFRLYSSRRFQSLPSHQDSELLRSSLEELVLTAKLMGLAPGQGASADDGIHRLLLKAMDPPHPLAITNAVELLRAIECLDKEERITTIGRTLSLLPVDPCLGRVILLGALLGCVGPMIRVVCAMSYRDPFVMPATDQQRADCNRMKARLARGVPSDQLTLLHALSQYESALKSGAGVAQRFCDDYFLSKSTLSFVSDLCKQVSRYLENCTGISSKHPFNSRHSGSIPLQCALIGAGLLSSTAARKKGTSVFVTEKGCKVKVHPSSVNAKKSRSSAFAEKCEAEVEMIGYQELVAISGGPSHCGGASLQMLSTTPISVFSFLLCCGSLTCAPITTETVENDEGDIDPLTVEVLADGWLALRTSIDTYQLISSIRVHLMTALVTYLQSPGRSLPPHLAALLDGIVKAFSFEQFGARVSGSKPPGSMSPHSIDARTARQSVEGPTISGKQSTYRTRNKKGSKNAKPS
mmetsp:Transcript_10858/g.16532  ORF Transcript_10858/g.16532 Transcript_10858/m.16532 type:complete len:1122 (-) Transcript_10858:128-3493(-)